MKEHREINKKKIEQSRSTMRELKEGDIIVFNDNFDLANGVKGWNCSCNRINSNRGCGQIMSMKHSKFIFVKEFITPAVSREILLYNSDIEVGRVLIKKIDKAVYIDKYTQDGWKALNIDNF